MKGIYDWVRSITCYVILICTVENLLADSKYEKYFHFFGGILLILITLRPVTGILGLDQRIGGLFEQISFQKEAGDFKERLWGMEDQRLDQVMEAYEEGIAQDLKEMAQMEGFCCSQVQAEIERDPESSDYGRVRTLALELSQAREEPAAAAVPKIQIGEWEQSRETGNPPDSVRDFARKVAEYYGLEREDIQIHWLDD